MYFHTFLTLIKNGGESIQTLTKSEVNFITSNIEDCRQFVFKFKEKTNLEKVIDDLPIPVEVDLPFKVCWFEMEKDFYISAERPDDPIIVRALGLFIVESEPRFYIVYGLMQSCVSGKWQHHIVNFTANGSDGSILTIINLLLSRFKKDKAISINTGTQIIYRNNGKKIKSKLKPVIYIGTEKQLNNYLSCNKIPNHKYSYCFDVRGHWRRIENTESLGKDRLGERTIKGWTWINPYLKGSSENNYVNKIRMTG